MGVRNKRGVEICLKYIKMEKGPYNYRVNWKFQITKDKL